MHNSKTLSTLFFLLAIGGTFSQSQAIAQDKPQISGVAVVEECKTLKVNGQRIALWGIDTLAPDQQCWQEETAWPCGEESLMALRHFVDGKMVRCEVQSAADAEGPIVAKCYRIKGAQQIDISEHLIRHGWALERGVATGGAYFTIEQDAQNNKLGIWGSRFQTAQDWREGIQRFVGEEEPVEPPPSDLQTPSE